MKILIVIIGMLFTSAVLSQNSPLELTENGVEPTIIKLDSLSPSQIYKKVDGWIQTNYKNPSEVIKGNIENEMIRISGFQKDFFSRKYKSGNIVFYDVSYGLTFEFQNEKMRVTFQPQTIKVDGSKVHFTENDFFGGVDVNGNGYGGSAESYNISLEKLLTSITKYIKGSDSKDW